MNRREFIKTTEIAGAGALLDVKKGRSEPANKRGNSPEIKNILLLFVDQHRQDCCGCYGNEIVRTPNIDRLAQNGVMFSNAYTPAPVCTPARASLQTGLWPHNHKLTFNTHRTHLMGGVDDPDPSIGFFSDTLKEKGWQLAHIGKWHIGTDQNKPSDHGYDDLPYYPGYGYPSRHPHYVEYLKKHGVNGFNLLSEKKDPTGLRPYSGLQEGPQSASIPAYLANQTIDVINRFIGSDNPFFVSCNFWGPHAPYNITKKHLEMYRGADIRAWPNFNCDLSDKPGVITRYGEYWKTGWFDEDSLAELIGEYYGYISLIDEEIGRILKALEDSGELDQTLIIYSADHGSSVGSYRFWDKGFGMYDVITRIPMVFSHPSITPAESDAFVTLLDFAPTLLEIAGCNVPDVVDGASLMPVLQGSKKSIREDYIVTEHHGHQLPFWQRMVRTPGFKYIYNPTSRDEFYDLESDPHETKNIINNADRERLSWAKEILIQWMKGNKDPLLFWAKTML
jgi:arylsulfatase A-like enzyme